MKTKLVSRILLVVFALIIVLSTIQPNAVFANNLSGEKPEKHVKAYLLNNSTKEKFELPVKVKESENGKSASYEVIVMSGSLSETHYKWDTTAGVKLTVTQYYDETWVGNQKVALDRSTAKWQKTDNTITIKNALVRSAVWGYRASDGTFLSKSETKTIGTPSLNTWYTQTPSWRGTYIIIDDIAYQATSASSTLVRGGSSWTLQLCVSQGGSAQMDCQ